MVKHRFKYSYFKNEGLRIKHFQSLFLMGCLILLGLLQAHGQTREELEQNQHALQQEIRLTGELLAETQRSAEVSLNHLVMLNSQISRREQLLGNIQLEIRLINNRINTLTRNIAELEEELEALKEAYAQMIRLAARNKDALQRMMFIFSAESFNQAYLRVRYLQQYSYHRKLQAEKLAETNVLLAEQKVALETERNKQQVQLKQQRDQVRDLNIEKASQERTVSELKTQEQQLMQQLREQERAARELQNAIRRIIEEERRRARERAEAEGRVTTDMYALTPEEQLLSDNFAGNRGSLPWPLERGIITGHFGEQPHPVLPGIKISNNGLNISTSEGSRARAIFDGKVSRIITVPGGFYAIIVRHGEYLSVYSNLSEVFVTNGQTVNTRDELGVVGTNHRESKTYLHLEIWKGNEKQNPASWIARQHE
jgi:murein hydrolase activator